MQLNLSLCNNSIQYNIPFELNDDVEKYNPNSGFYKTICSQYTSESGTDLSNYDRKNDFNEKNMALCENGCEFKEYNNQSKKVICDCRIKDIFNTFDVLNISNFVQKFSIKENIFNLNVIKCYKLLFSNKGIISNIGSYINLIIIMINIVLFFIFYSNDYNSYCNNIKVILKNNSKSNISNDNKEEIITENKQENEKKKSCQLNKKIKKIRQNKNRIENNNRAHDIYGNKSSGKKLKFSKNKLNNKNKRIKLQKNVNPGSKNSLRNEDNKNNNNNKFSEMNDYELNTLVYELALKYDTRTTFEYYFSLLRKKQILIFSFYTKTDYNSRIIKIIRFFSFFALYFATETLFFNDSTLHVIYKNSGVYNIILQLPQIIYSNIISGIIEALVSFLILTEKNVVEIKNMTNKNDKDDITNFKYEQFISNIKIKFIIFFIINYIFLFFIWYYISCFCAIYKNTQIYLIKDTLSGFGLSLLYPFITCLFPCFFRKCSLDKNNKKECLYNISKFLQYYENYIIFCFWKNNLKNIIKKYK